MSDQQWTENDSVLFADLGGIFTPNRDEIARIAVEHIPARADEPFLTVDLCCGDGWLSGAILTAFPNARLLALDGSPEMLRRTAARLDDFGDRARTQRFDLGGTDWLDAIGEPVHAFVSSLAIHHLDGAGKRALFQRLHNALGPGGVFIYVDLIEPVSEIGRRYAARAWDDWVKRASQEQTGSDRVWRTFDEADWNWFAHPDPLDMPSSIPDVLGWLREPGFTGVDLPWVHAGHAIFVAYRAQARTPRAG